MISRLSLSSLYLDAWKYFCLTLAEVTRCHFVFASRNGDRNCCWVLEKYILNYPGELLGNFWNFVIISQLAPCCYSNYLIYFLLFIVYKLWVILNIYFCCFSGNICNIYSCHYGLYEFSYWVPWRLQAHRRKKVSEQTQHSFQGSHCWVVKKDVKVFNKPKKIVGFRLQ